MLRLHLSWTAKPNWFICVYDYWHCNIKDPKTHTYSGEFEKWLADNYQVHYFADKAGINVYCDSNEDWVRFCFIWWNGENDANVRS